MMNRRTLLGMTGAAGAALTVATLPGLRHLCGKPNGAVKCGRCVKLSPIAGISYSAATLAFMDRARFDTPRQAIYGMKDPNIQFLIEHVSA